MHRLRHGICGNVICTFNTLVDAKRVGNVFLQSVPMMNPETHFIAGHYCASNGNSKGHVSDRALGIGGFYEGHKVVSNAAEAAALALQLAGCESQLWQCIQ